MGHKKAIADVYLTLWSNTVIEILVYGWVQSVQQNSKGWQYLLVPTSKRVFWIRIPWQKFHLKLLTSSYIVQQYNHRDPGLGIWMWVIYAALGKTAKVDNICRFSKENILNKNNLAKESFKNCWHLLILCNNTIIEILV